MQLANQNNRFFYRPELSNTIQLMLMPPIQSITHAKHHWKNTYNKT